MPEIRDFTDLAAYAQEQLERISRMQSDMAGAAGEGVSPQRYARARTGPGGQVLELRLDRDASSLPVAELADEIVAAISAAQADYAAQTDAIMGPLLEPRPSDTFDDGIRRLDALTDDLDRLMQRRDLR
ncbi:YbaB/EbfC family nucleoid-associated protein [Paractinoplanes lichenicola]|uniref:YbaB/EbfC family nucleoid-associated protein n=1 Tax=Paractinoplanes lichenicola TaxID=2802976 RepID=A0ABS1VWP7_9ACTN|nr:YbaB/EbfC family nucleoid-associated protein [Actinoplanes lichenicola]MBL7258882.1 YbaB/EbfC family nucleoid-associated protein [Actinoplanes lichenicola]